MNNNSGKLFGRIVRATFIAMVVLLYSPALHAQATAPNPSVDAATVKEFEQAKQTFKSFRAESAQEFAKMKQYHEKLSTSGKITHQFRTADGELIHCIEISSQESLKRTGQNGSTIRLAPEPTPAGEAKTTGNHTANPAAFGMDGSLDSDGNVRRCPAGCIWQPCAPDSRKENRAPP